MGFFSSLIHKIKPVNPKKYGILGMNARNIDYVLNYNDRKNYPLVDNKLRTKQIAIDHHIKVPLLYAHADYIYDIDKIIDHLHQYRDGFVIKPVAGAGGGGIIVIQYVKGEHFITSSGKALTKQDIAYHMANILAGLYSLGGKPDQVMIEKRIETHPIFDKIIYKGVPDVRVIVFKGYPIMAMLRLPTRASDGKANLHIGGIGVGLDMRTGCTNYAIYKGSYIQEHIDTFAPLSNIMIPDWRETLEIAASLGDILPLGYIGCDFIYDAHCGTHLLEVNARPGLAVQMANKSGLLPRLEAMNAHIADLKHKNIMQNCAERIAWVQSNF